MCFYLILIIHLNVQNSIRTDTKACPDRRIKVTGEVILITFLPLDCLVFVWYLGIDLTFHRY